MIGKIPSDRSPAPQHLQRAGMRLPMSTSATLHTLRIARREREMLFIGTQFSILYTCIRTRIFTLPVSPLLVVLADGGARERLCICVCARMFFCVSVCSCVYVCMEATVCVHVCVFSCVSFLWYPVSVFNAVCLAVCMCMCACAHKCTRPRACERGAVCAVFNLRGWFEK